MQKKLKVGVLFGGRSVEHEISLRSARNIISAMDPDRYEPILIGIDKGGAWHLCDLSGVKQLALTTLQSVVLVPEEKSQLVSLSNHKMLQRLDLIFPVLHGQLGEDGTVQGLCKLANLPFVGPSVMSSAIGMDKEVSKRLLREAGVPVARFKTVHRHEMSLVSTAKVIEELGLPLFVKPSNGGSSIGVTKVKNASELEQAILDAFQYDRKILIEEFITGREIECGVIGNEHPLVSVPGEITFRDEFYTYDAKYFDKDGTQVEIPARLTPLELSNVQTNSVKAYVALCCEGMARIDGFLKADGEFIVSEINTIPGCTDMSPFPHLWAASGVPFPELINRLIEYALDRFEKESALKTHHQVKVAHET